MITDGKDKLISQSTSSVPYMGDALNSWMRKITISKITKTLVDMENVETKADSTVLAVIQPFSVKQLLIKPEGQRSWAWFTLHIKSGIEYTLDDIIELDGVTYRVMEKYMYGDYGFFEYHIIKDFTGTE